MTTAFQATSHFSSNPVFSTGASTGPAASLQEERRLLGEERSRQGSKFGKKHSKNVEIVPSTLPLVEGGISNPKAINEDNIEENSDIPSLSAVTDKIQLDSIAQCYSSLLKGVFANTCGLNTFVLSYCRIACSQYHFRIILYTTTVDSCSYESGILHKCVYCCCYGNGTNHNHVHVTDIKSPFSTISNCVYFAVSVISDIKQ